MISPGQEILFVEQQDLYNTSWSGSDAKTAINPGIPASRRKHESVRSELFGFDRETRCKNGLGYLDSSISR